MLKTIIKILRIAISYTKEYRVLNRADTTNYILSLLLIALKGRNALNILIDLIIVLGLLVFIKFTQEVTSTIKSNQFQPILR